MMKNKGFTLTEIIAVIVVLGLLIVIAMPIYNGIQRNVKENALNSKKRSLEIAAVRYANDNNVSGSLKITGTKLVLDNYYEAEGYKNNDRELPIISNPLDSNDNLACHIISIAYNNFDYEATVLDESNCDISKNEVDASKISVEAYEVGTNTKILSTSQTQTSWTNKNVLVRVTNSDSTYDGIEYTIYGNTTRKTTGTKNCGASGNVDSCMNLFRVDAGLFLNSDLYITLIKSGQNDVTRTVTIRIDKEAPTILEDVSYNDNGMKKDSSVLTSDGNGSGVSKVYYARKDQYEANGNRIEATLQDNGNGTKRAILDNNMANTRYYVWAKDAAGNESSIYQYQAKNIIEEVTVTYNGNGGTPSKTSDKIDKGTKLTSIASATREGHTFDGWYTQASGGTKITSDSTIDTDMTLYAHWTVNQYYLDLNGYLDGIGTGNITGYGRASIYINGSLVESNVSDWYQSYPYGTTYEIKNITTTTGHTYNGVYSGSLSGTITGNVNVVLKYTTESRYVYASAGSGGSVSPTSKVLKYNEGTSFTVTPSSGYYLSSYSCDSGLSLSSSFGTGSNYTGSQTRTIYNYSSGTGSKYCYFYFTAGSRRIYTRTYSNFDVVVGYEEIGSSDELNDKYLAYDDIVVDPGYNDDVVTEIVCGVSPYYRDLNYGESGTFTVQLGSNYYLEYISCDSGVTYSGFSTGKSTQGRTITGTIKNNSTGSDSKYCNFYYDYVNTASSWCADVRTKDVGGYNDCGYYYNYYEAVYSCNPSTGYSTLSNCYHSIHWNDCHGIGWYWTNYGSVPTSDCVGYGFYRNEDNCSCTTYLNCCNSGVMYSSYSSGVISPSNLIYRDGELCVSTC